MDKKRIWLSLAQMSGYEMQYIQEAFTTNWIAPIGPNITAFELVLQNYLFNEEKDKGYVVALNTGTAAMHLALLLLGVKCHDEVICQSFTFAATANVIRYLNATPIFIDSEPETWNIDPKLVEDAIKSRYQITGSFPKAILTVNLYGMPAKMDELLLISQKYKIPIIEDAAESLGSSYKGRKCGTFGKMGIISFNGNKIITTSGGGALICHDKSTADKTVYYATQARDNLPYYQHKEVGYNYRMSNVCAGIGRGQMEMLNEFLQKRKHIHSLYATLLKDVSGITVHENPNEDYNSNFWLTCILINPEVYGKTIEEVRLLFEAENIEVRLLWKPMHLQPVYTLMPYYGNGVSENLFMNGLCLPSGCGLTEDDIHSVVKVLLK